jgi:uncharacterized damage-inducible protein DinB
MTNHLMLLYRRDLEKLIAELELYGSESDLWRVTGEITNSAGNLALHVIGNLNHFIGVKLGHSNFVRDRDAEFSLRDVPRAELVQQLRQTIVMLETTLPTLDAAALDAPFPLEVLGYPMTAGYFLIHLYGHLNYHLGQVNYLRRLVSV